MYTHNHRYQIVLTVYLITLKDMLIFLIIYNFVLTRIKNKFNAIVNGFAEEFDKIICWIKVEEVSTEKNKISFCSFKKIGARPKSKQIIK